MTLKCEVGLEELGWKKNPMQESSENQFCRIKSPKIRLQKDISISFWMLGAARIDRLKKYASFILQIKIKYLRYCLPLRSLNGSRECYLLSYIPFNYDLRN